VSDGPRALAPSEWDQLDHVVGTVFRPTMFHNYPQLFNDANRENLRVVADDGKLVCHVGMIERAASLAGCRVDVCCIGGVATLNEYRGKGYASAAFQDACDKAARDGMDVMLISGGRGLYTRVGCRQVGLDWDFTLDEAEHVRFIRRVEDWEMALDCRIVMNTASDFWGVWLGDTLVAYAIVHDPTKARRRPEDAALTRVVEFAGQRAAILSSLPELRRRYGTERLRIHAQGSDPVLAEVLRASTGAEGAPSGFSGTLRVINFAQLLERCRPLLAERIGWAKVRDMSFTADAPAGKDHGGFMIRRETQEVRLADLGSAANFLFGARSRPAEDSEPTGDAALKADLSRALPLPVPWYGISYV
jgi:predicted N-acetyltransferase YhbS